MNKNYGVIPETKTLFYHMTTRRHNSLELVSKLPDLTVIGELFEII